MKFRDLKRGYKEPPRLESLESIPYYLGYNFSSLDGSDYYPKTPMNTSMDAIELLVIVDGKSYRHHPINIHILPYWENSAKGTYSPGECSSSTC